MPKTCRLIRIHRVAVEVEVYSGMKIRPASDLLAMEVTHMVMYCKGSFCLCVEEPGSLVSFYILDWYGELLGLDRP